MNKKIKSIAVVILILSFFVGLFVIPKVFEQEKRGKFQSIWLTYVDSKAHLLFHLTDTRKSGRMYDDYEQIKLVDISNGKLVGEHELESEAITNFRILCMSSKNLWIAADKGYQCLSLPELKVNMDFDQVKNKILKAKPEIDNIHSVTWQASDTSFLVENNIAEEFMINPLDLMSDDSLMILNRNNQMGSIAHYEVFKPVYETVSITIEDIGAVQDDAPIYYDYGMTLEDKLKLEKGFEKNYAVILPDTNCLVLDENKRRILKILVDDQDSLSWKYLANEQVWLKGEFLRPTRTKGSLPKNRSVIHTDNEVFIFTHTSLETENDSIYLTAYNYTEDTSSWKINLTSFDISSSYYPIENMIFEDALISLWLDENNDFVLLSLDITNGVEKWRYLGE